MHCWRGRGSEWWVSGEGGKVTYLWNLSKKANKKMRMLHLAAKYTRNKDHLKHICHTPHLCAIFWTNIMVLGPCVAKVRSDLSRVSLRSLSLLCETNGARNTSSCFLVLSFVTCVDTWTLTLPATETERWDRGDSERNVIKISQNLSPSPTVSVAASMVWTTLHHAVKPFPSQALHHQLILRMWTLHWWSSKFLLL